MRLVPPVRWLRGPHPMVLAIAAAFCAAALVLYFQYRAISALHSQTDVILRQLSEQTASDVATEVRRILDGPVNDTLTSVNHPDLREGRLDLVAQEYAQAIDAYPHVDRFLVWTAETEAVAPGEVLFFASDSRSTTGRLEGTLDSFVRDPSLGRTVKQLADQHRPAQHIYVAAERLGPDGRYQAFLRLFWTDARRVEYFAILGFVIDPESTRQRFFATLYDRTLAGLLTRRGGAIPLRLRVTDDTGALVYGDLTPLVTAASVSLPMLFYPTDRIGSRLAHAVPARPWRIEVGASDRRAVADVGLGYWPTAVSVLLMFVALGLTVQANRRAAELTRMQADFISHVSHQLKTPLSLLSAATETVSMDRVRSPQKLAQYLNIIRSEVTRLSSLVQRILEFSRLQQPRAFEFETVDLGALVRETVAAFEQSLSGQFTFSVDETGRPFVRADPAAIEQALVNLLDNAVKYSGDIREVTVKLRTVANDAVIEVIDRGIGIDRADQRHIFEKFYRGRGASLHREGFGLGLPIVQELVRAHRGVIEVESTLGQGSTFRLRLPLAKPEHVETVAVSSQVEQSETPV
jgi:signal transduction histidine kinase